MLHSSVHVLGLQPQFIVLPMLFLIGAVIGVPLIFVWARILEKSSDYNFPIRGYIIGVIGWIAIAMSVITGAAWPLSAIPMQPKYWPYYSVSGTIEHVSNGFSDGSGDTTVRVYVVQLKGDPRPYQLWDARVTTLLHQKVGLTCTLDWIDFGNSADQWECNIRTAPFTSEGE